MRLGASFSVRRARGRGLDPRAAFERLLDLGLDPLRLSAHWDDVERDGYGELDWLIAEAGRAGRGVLLTVGMKAQGWPEFAIPPGLVPPAPAGSDVAAADAPLRAAALGFVRDTAARYRDRAAVEAWQVENEPLNPSGPMRWWIGPDFLRKEIETVRGVDASRPLVVNVFASFNLGLDLGSNRHGSRALFGRRARRPEREALGLLQPGDILGLDVYRRIGYRRLGLRLLTTSSRWRVSAGRWLTTAEAERKQAWIVEAQAEPWEPAEPGSAPAGRPISCRPAEIGATVARLRRAGFRTILLWGAEHWLARDAGGDPSWLAEVTRLLS